MSTSPAFDAGRWFEAVPKRRSRRAYDSAPGAEDRSALAATAAAFAPFEDTRTVFVPLAPPGLFFGVIGSYGRVSGPCSAYIFVVDKSSPTADAHCGYAGEGHILEAHARGLSTCWIAGTFSRGAARELAGLRDGEVVRAVSPVGRPAERFSSAERVIYGQGRPKARKSLEQIAVGSDSWPKWALEGVRAAQIAPSAMNKQPWLFRYEGGAVTISTQGSAGGMARIDCGIAMLHFELGARSEGSDGAWVSLAAPDVARWEPFT
jgi:hypothetical protein